MSDKCRIRQIGENDAYFVLAMGDRGVTLTELMAAVESALGLSKLQPIGSGGQKIVATADFGGHPAIVKIVLIPPGPNGLMTLERAHREVELLAAVDSDAVVKVLTDAVEIGDTPDAVCWVEERLEGDDLDHHLSSQWDESAAWVLAEDLAAALVACHEQEVVHRDLSPRNIRRLPNGRYVVMDPGLARHLARAAITGLMQPGSFGWMSPEHVPGGRAVPASDVFSVGVVLYCALSGGDLPIPYAFDDQDYFRRLAHEQASSVRAVRPDISEVLVALVDRCLERQAARRFLDGEELLAAVRASRGGIQ